MKLPLLIVKFLESGERAFAFGDYIGGAPKEAPLTFLA
jgi:hypothetical protein